MSLQEILIRTAFKLLGLRNAPGKAPVFDKLQVNKILVVRNDNLGDVILTVPTLRALRQAYPKAFLAVLVNNYTRPALEGIPWIDKVYGYDKFKHGTHSTRFHAWLQKYNLLKELQRQNFDLAIGVRSNFSSSQGLMIYSSAARWRVGRKPNKKKGALVFYYNIFYDLPMEGKHEVNRSLDSVRILGIDTLDKRLEFFIPLNYQQQIDTWLSAQKPDKPLLGVYFTRRLEEGRSWTEEKYATLINTLQQQNRFVPIIIHAPNDQETIECLSASLEKRVPTFSTIDLKLLAALLSKCRLVFTLDGGGMHLTAAVGTPEVAIFGKASPKVWHPWIEKHIVIQKGQQENTVTVDDVLAAIEQLETVH